MSRRFLFLFLSLFTLALVACSGSATPQLIASYPNRPPSSPPQPNTILVYNTYLELDVAEVTQAGSQATQIAYRRGGYLVSSQSWYRDGRLYTTLELAVPQASLENTLGELHRLGNVASERISGQPANTTYRDEWNVFSRITVQLRPAAYTWTRSEPAPHVWNPGHTFASAFEVGSTILKFLIDALIWIIVVSGPFILIALALRMLYRRLRHP